MLYSDGGLTVRNVLQEIERRIITSFMDFLILSILSHSDGYFSGYDIIKHIHTHFRFLASSGTVYANLYAMERNGLLQGTQQNRRRVYRLSPQGYEMVWNLEKANCNVQAIIATIFPKSITVPQLS